MERHCYCASPFAVPRRLPQGQEEGEPEPVGLRHCTVGEDFTILPVSPSTIPIAVQPRSTLSADVSTHPSGSACGSSGVVSRGSSSRPPGSQVAASTSNEFAPSLAPSTWLSGAALPSSSSSDRHSATSPSHAHTLAGVHTLGRQQERSWGGTYTPLSVSTSHGASTPTSQSTPSSPRLRPRQHAAGCACARACMHAPILRLPRCVLSLVAAALPATSKRRARLACHALRGAVDLKVRRLVVDGPHVDPSAFPCVQVGYASEAERLA